MERIAKARRFRGIAINGIVGALRDLFWRRICMLIIWLTDVVDGEKVWLRGWTMPIVFRETAQWVSIGGVSMAIACLVDRMLVGRYRARLSLNGVMLVPELLEIVVYPGSAACIKRSMRRVFVHATRTWSHH